MPVMRVREGTRGPVIANSEKLDAWLEHRSFVTEQKMSSPRAIRKRATNAGIEFVRTELATGREFAKIASRSANVATAARRRKAARRAYDTLYHILSETLLPEAEKKRFNRDLEAFKRELQKLGEQF